MRHVMTASLLVLVLCGVCFSDDAANSKEINDVLSLILQGTYKDGGFTVVTPETAFSEAEGDQEAVSQSKAYIVKNMQIPGYDITLLVGQLFEKNQQRSRLTLKSDPPKGYVIDYDGQYNQYFEEGGGGWEKWYKDHPEAHGSTRVSLPVVDKTAGIVLVYKGTQSHWRSGAGYVIAYKYKDGQLEELKRVMLWIS